MLRFSKTVTLLFVSSHSAVYKTRYNLCQELHKLSDSADIFKPVASLQLRICRLKYSRIYSSKSPASGVGNIIESCLKSQVGRVREDVCALMVCFCSRSGGGASVRLLT